MKIFLPNEILFRAILGWGTLLVSAINYRGCNRSLHSTTQPEIQLRIAEQGIVLFN